MWLLTQNCIAFGYETVFRTLSDTVCDIYVPQAFVKAFKDAKPVAMPITQALAFSNNLQARMHAFSARRGRRQGHVRESPGR